MATVQEMLRRRPRALSLLLRNREASSALSMAPCQLVLAAAVFSKQDATSPVTCMAEVHAPVHAVYVLIMQHREQLIRPWL